MNRRQFGALAVGLGRAYAKAKPKTSSIDEVFRTSAAANGIPAAVAVVATKDDVIYSGAFGKRDSVSGVAVEPSAIFSIASMTKPITTTAALQLVERGALRLDEPVAKHLPELAKLQILDGFDRTGSPILRPAMRPVTLKHLLTHTSGFGYDFCDGNLLRYHRMRESPTANSLLDQFWRRWHGSPSNTKVANAPAPLLFEPGTRWQYGESLDWVGRLIEAVSGLTLEQYFQRNILQPLAMADTTYIPTAAQFERTVSTYYRQADGSLKERTRRLGAPPKLYDGGGGLRSSGPDYVRFMQMILRRGSGDRKQQILRPETVDMMTHNQIGDLAAGRWRTSRPELSCDVDFHPGFLDKWGYGFLINPIAHERGRSAGSLAWGGIENTFFWIDPKRGVCAVLMMQFLPFCDPHAVAVLRDFECAGEGYQYRI